MKIGLLLPQGYFNEFEGWLPVAAWERILEIARLGERLGFDALWTGEHTLAKWDPEGIIFDCVTLHTAVAASVPRVAVERRSLAAYAALADAYAGAEA